VQYRVGLTGGIASGNSAVGAGFRGFWAYEGKILVLLDGIEVNEGLYGCVMMGDHYSAEQIKQFAQLFPNNARPVQSRNNRFIIQSN
jgi:carbonic anhydrase